MATLIADVTRVESLAEQFGRQRLEEDLQQVTRRAEILGSQLSPDKAANVRLSSHHSAWLICERTPTKSKHESYTNHRIKEQFASRNLQHLNGRERPQLVSEVRIVKFVSNKRNLKRNQAVRPSRGEKEFIFDKDKLNIVSNERDEGLDLSSSSEDELRELFGGKAKPSEVESAPQRKAEDTGTFLARPSALDKDQNDKQDTRRKRNKICRGSLKKKVKISRPCLDLEKMLARRVEDLKTDSKDAENIFHPIDQM